MQGYNPRTARNPFKETLLSNENHDWGKPMEQGPGDVGFDTSYVSLAGLQNPPYMFLRNNVADIDTNNIKFWEVGNFSMPSGLSKIDKRGEGAADWDSTAYNQILVNETIKFLDDHLENDADKPFFTYVALGAVHTPHSPPDTYLKGERIAGEYPTPHMDVLLEMDMIVGTYKTMLEERGLLEDTIFFFTSDNGGLGMNTGSDSGRSGHHSGGPLRSEKASIYEGGHRIPMTISWPGGNIPAGERRSHYVGLNDIFATLCDLAGIKVPKSQAVDSISFADYLKDGTKTNNLRKTLGFWSFVKYGNSFRLGKESIRMGDMKLIHDYQTDKFELYNLASDLAEGRELALGDNINSTLIDEMYKELKSFGPCHDRIGKFKIRGQKKPRRCKWFAKKDTFARCEKFQEGWQHCRLTCALRSSAQCKSISDLNNKDQDTDAE